MRETRRSTNGAVIAAAMYAAMAYEKAALLGATSVHATMATLAAAKAATAPRVRAVTATAEKTMSPGSRGATTSSISTGASNPRMPARLAAYTSAPTMPVVRRLQVNALSEYPTLLAPNSMTDRTTSPTHGNAKSTAGSTVRARTSRGCARSR